MFAESNVCTFLSLVTTGGPCLSGPLQSPLIRPFCPQLNICLLFDFSGSKDMLREFNINLTLIQH